MMKKILLWFSVIALAFSFVACAPAVNQNEVLTESIPVETMVIEETTMPTDPVIIETAPPEEELRWEVPGETYTIDITHEATTDLELIAWVIYMEQGSDIVCDTCRRRTADVILNLTECKITNTGNDYYWPDTIRGVISGGGINPYQNMGNSTNWPDTAHSERERHAVERAFKIAHEVLRGQHSDLYRKGYFYYAGANAYGNEPDTAIQCCETYFMRLRGWDNSKFEQDWFFFPPEED